MKSLNEQLWQALQKWVKDHQKKVNNEQTN
jgi:hypothetical protein